METEVEAPIGAAYGEKDTCRRAQRNGNRDRDLETPAGRIALENPMLRKGNRFIGFSGTAVDGGEGTDSVEPGSLCSGHLDAVGRHVSR
jgi:hypothetical protein